MKIQFQNVTKAYENKLVLDRMTLAFPDHGFVCIVGPSGAGKTTIFRLLLGLIQPDAGEIHRLQETESDYASDSGSNFKISSDLVSKSQWKLQFPSGSEAGSESRPERLFSVVFQEDRLLPWSSVLDNVLLVGGTKKVCSPELRDKAIQILTELGLGREFNSCPAELSGGMARRVAIARALAANAEIYLMDEPTRGLDEETRKHTLEVIRRYTDQAVNEQGQPCGKLLIMITHNPEETEGAQVIHLSQNNRAGKLKNSAFFSIQGPKAAENH